MARKSSRTVGPGRLRARWRGSRGPGLLARALGAVRSRWSWKIAVVVGLNAGVAALALGALAGVSLNEGWFKRRAAETRRAGVKLTIGWPAIAGDPTRTWLPESARREIAAVAARELTNDPFDRHALEGCRAALMGTGWFTAIDGIRRHAGSEVRVDARWRTPAAVVRWGGKDHLVSTNAELMPLVYGRGEAGAGVRVIEGVQFGPPTRESGSLACGEVWPGGDVQPALALLGGLKEAFGQTTVWSQVAGVDVSRVPVTGAVAIVTDTGSRVVWGAAPGKVVPGEQTVDQKLLRLARLAKGPTGRIDAGERFVEIHGAHVFVEQAPAVASGAPTEER